MDIVDRIKLLVSEKGLTIGDIEDACNFPEKSIYKWNKNKPSIDRVVKVAQYLKVSTDYLLGTSEYKTKYDEWDTKYNNDSNIKNKAKTLELIDTIAAHRDGEDLTDEQLEKLKEYAKFIFSQKNR